MPKLANICFVKLIPDHPSIRVRSNLKILRTKAKSNNFDSIDVVVIVFIFKLFFFFLLRIYHRCVTFLFRSLRNVNVYVHWDNNGLKKKWKISDKIMKTNKLHFDVFKELNIRKSTHMNRKTSPEEILMLKKYLLLAEKKI